MGTDQYENNAEGILCVYKNPKWLVCIKNWKPDNDIAGIAHLEVHHSTDEQFILAAGKGDPHHRRARGRQLQEYRTDPHAAGQGYTMFPLSAGSTPSRKKDTKVIYVQDSNCSMENSDFADLTAAQIADIQGVPQDPRRVKGAFMPIRCVLF